MKFSTQEDYGLRCLLQIARRPETETALTIPEISRLEGLSQTHVAKLLMILRQSGFVRSSRGQAGGYRMAHDPKDVTVGAVLEALGGKLYDSDFCERHSGQLDICTHAVDCGVRSLWQNVQKAVDSVVDRITIADLIGPQIEIPDIPENRFAGKSNLIPPDPMTETFPVTVTERALAQIRRLVQRDGRPDVFLRLGVKGGGCSGFEYVSKLDTARKAIDIEMDFDGVKVVVDAKSAVFLQGATFDHTGNLIGGGFKFENPNAARSCGCGTSFTPKSA